MWGYICVTDSYLSELCLTHIPIAWINLIWLTILRLSYRKMTFICWVTRCRYCVVIFNHCVIFFLIVFASIFHLLFFHLYLFTFFFSYVSHFPIIYIIHCDSRPCERLPFLSQSFSILMFSRDQPVRHCYFRCLYPISPFSSYLTHFPIARITLYDSLTYLRLIEENDLYFWVIRINIFFSTAKSFFFLLSLGLWPCEM